MSDPSYPPPENVVIRALIAEPTVMAVIVINTTALFLLGFAEWEAAQTSSELGFRAAWWTDYACTLFFVAEASLKIRHFGWPRYWAKRWNRFDLLVAVISLPALISIFSIEIHHVFSGLLALRAGRLLRLIKLMRVIPDSDRMLAGVWRALKASIGVLAALTILNLVLGLLASTLFGRLPSPTAQAAFGDPLSSFYSIFKVFTVEGWYEIPEKIAHETTPVWAGIVQAFFMVVVVAGGLFGISIANAVFVDEMVKDNNLELEQDLHLLREQLAQGLARLEAAQNDLQTIAAQQRQALQDLVGLGRSAPPEA
ncbi:MAG: ion transporter [Planctomycetes bacterium]|nr:ion transporter [Planctomycetota bacterium]